MVWPKKLYKLDQLRTFWLELSPIISNFDFFADVTFSCDWCLQFLAFLRLRFLASFKWDRFQPSRNQTSHEIYQKYSRSAWTTWSRRAVLLKQSKNCRIKFWIIFDNYLNLSKITVNHFFTIKWLTVIFDRLR